MSRRLRVIAISALSLYLILYFGIPSLIPIPVEISTPKPSGITYLDRDGLPLRRTLSKDDLKIDAFVAFSDLPESLVFATIAAEDKRFFHHDGIDYLGIARSLRDGIKRKKVVSGASTISQQLVKISSPRRSRSFTTKLIEIATARKLEIVLSKESILTGYLNRLPYGNQISGIRGAARHYFGKPVSDLSLAESALLAGLPNQPSRLNPWKNEAGAIARQRWVLQRMLDEDFISDEVYQIAIAEPLTFQKPHGSSVFRAPHFVDLLRQQTGLSTDTQVTTTIDLGIHQSVESTVTERLAHLPGTQAAAVVIENKTGSVLALIGSRSFSESASGQTNGAMAARSAGSTLKPFTYLLALERDYSAGSILPDIPINYVSRAGAFEPVNFDRTYQGPVTLRQALATSLNVPAVRVLNDIGGPRVLHRLLREGFGFSSLNDNGDVYGLGLTIGNAEVRLLELTNAYACLARMGSYLPYRLTPGPTPEHRQLLDATSSWIITDILADNAARAPAFGRDSALRLPFPVAAKTGTSTDYRDSWTLGYTPEYTVGVWMGNFDNRPLPQNLTGARGAGPIFRDIMLALHPEEKEATWYTRPESLVKACIDPRNGLQIHPNQRHSQTTNEWFLPEKLPQLATTNDYSHDGRAILSRDYRTWSTITPHYTLAEDDGSATFQILSPKPETTAYLDPDLANSGNRMLLKTDSLHPSQIRWHSDTLEILQKGSHTWALLTPGEHHIQAIHPDTGHSVSTHIEVEQL